MLLSTLTAVTICLNLATADQQYMNARLFLTLSKLTLNELLDSYAKKFSDLFR